MKGRDKSLVIAGGSGRGKLYMTVDRSCRIDLFRFCRFYDEEIGLQTQFWQQNFTYSARVVIGKMLSDPPTTFPHLSSVLPLESGIFTT
jgi:hypothetical protein